MIFTRIPEDTFKNIQLNAGILVKGFDPTTMEIEGLMGATTGGVNFTATPTFEDFGEDIDNCPKNSLELKKLTEWAVSLSGTFVTINLETAKTLVGAGEVSGSKIVPRNDVLLTDFEDVWWIGDYSEVNTGAGAGYCAVHMLNALNTGGFQIQSSDKGKGNFAFNFEGHYSMNAQDTVPFEVYIKSGGSSILGSILFDRHTGEIEVGDDITIKASTQPSDAVITWDSSDDTVATVSNGVVTGEGAGNCIIKGTITVDGIDYDDTCTIIVTGE
jgi:hypothetical protein